MQTTVRRLCKGGLSNSFRYASGLTHNECTPEDIIKKDKEYILGLYGRTDMVFTHGKGAYLFTPKGEKYLDFFSGIAVTSIGHSDPEWVAAMQDQIGKLVHLSNYHHNEWGVLVAERLVKSCSFADKVFFCNTGTEASEAAFKMSRKVAKLVHPEKLDVISFNGSFHGRTMGSLSMTYKAIYRDPFTPLLPNVHFANLNDISAVKDLITDRTAAVMVEPIQGEGGIHPCTTEFIHTLRELCNKHQASLVFDEVQCGLGRTGKLWAYEHFTTKDNEVIQPDILTFAKPIAGGLPMGGVLVNKHVATNLAKGDHGTTFGGGPLVCRAATVVFDRISNPKFLKQVEENGKFLIESLKAIKSEKIVDIRGSGLFVGIEFSQPVAPIITKAFEEGILIINAGENVIRLCPPLIVNREELTRVVEAIRKALV